MMKIPRKYALLFAVLGLLSLALAGCASTAARTATTTGKVTSLMVTDKIETSGNLGARELVQLTWGTSGIVASVNVKVGQKVKSGEVMASLAAASVPANLITAQSDLANAKRDLEDLQNSKLSQAQAQQAVLAARKAVEVALNNKIALDYPRASDALIKNTQARIWEAERNVTLAYNKYKELIHHEDGDPAKTAAALAYTKAQLTLNELKATYNYYISKPGPEDYAKAKAALDVARANLETARRKWDNVKNGIDPLALGAAQAKVVALQATVDSMHTIAPFDGEVISVQTASGNTVKNGDAAIALVDRNTLKVDTKIDETAISSVALGNPAEVTMDSMAGVTLKGKVTQISPIGSTVNGLVKFNVTVSLEPTDKPLLFGATANVVIYTGQPHSVLAVPVGAVASDTLGEYVQLVDAAGKTTRVEVVSGDLADTRVTVSPVTDGSLKEGDSVLVGQSSSSSSGSNSGNNGGGGIIEPPGGGGPPPGG